MIYTVLANGILLIHLLFVVFVVFGGVLVARRRRLAWFHAPAAIWGALVMSAGWTCPLTPLEWHLLELGGQSGYEGGFVEHYIVGMLYPSGLTRLHQIVLGLFVGLLNGAVYGRMVWRRGRRDPGASAN